MKLIRLILRSFRDARKSIVRNFSLTLASIFSITITLMIVLAALVTSDNIDNFSKIIKKDVTMVVFLNTDIADEQIKEIQNRLKTYDNIESYTYQSKNEIKEDMIKSSDTIKEIASNWESDSENPLKPTFLIKVKDINKIKDTADQIKKIEYVSAVKYGEGVIESFITVFKALEKGAYAVVITLILVTIFLIANTIKLTIFSRRKEIEIMRLVGASNISIKMPFIIEGLFTGILGAIIPIVTLIYGYIYFYTANKGILPVSPLFKLVAPVVLLPKIVLILLSISIIVGMFGSSSAVRKYLKI